MGYTGEIQNLASACEYKSDDPIRVQARLLFGLGRGPMADGEHKTYRYWVAVTDRNRAVPQKWTPDASDLPGLARIGFDHRGRLRHHHPPRVNNKVSGSNFEVLIGFDVTPEMADFNRQGKRFFANAGVATAQAGSAPGQ